MYYAEWKTQPSGEMTSANHRSWQALLIALLPHVLLWLGVFIFWSFHLHPSQYGMEQTQVDGLYMPAVLNELVYLNTLYWGLLLSILCFAFQLYTHRDHRLAAIALLAGVQFFFLGGYLIDSRTSLSFFWVFEHQRVEERVKPRPITFAGYGVGEYLVKVVKNKEDENRLAAIEALGQLNYREALPLLEELANNPSEIPMVRIKAAYAVKEMNE
ncbi:MAG TPA: HEAT repeat domain-containing protein [Luteibaculaceae bacterium]|nr:HEAT repeat domain-containing protein [Luteibaculaceae bacterium]